MKTFDECLRRGLIAKAAADERVIGKEIMIAERNLKSAKASLENDDFEWVCTQSYYSAFHAAKALLYKKGYKERSHRCLAVAVEALYRGEIEASVLKAIEELMAARTAANYGLEEIQESVAKSSFHEARQFLAKAKKRLGTE